MQEMNEENPNFIKYLIKIARESSKSAFSKAIATGLSILVQEKGNLVYLHANGTKTFCKKLEVNSNINIPKQFTLK